jgi:hypothetical protein
MVERGKLMRAVEIAREKILKPHYPLSDIEARDFYDHHLPLLVTHAEESLNSKK